MLRPVAQRRRRGALPTTGNHRVPPNHVDDDEGIIDSVRPADARGPRLGRPCSRACCATTAQPRSLQTANRHEQHGGRRTDGQPRRVTVAVRWSVTTENGPAGRARRGDGLGLGERQHVPSTGRRHLRGAPADPPGQPLGRRIGRDGHVFGPGQHQHGHVPHRVHRRPPAVPRQAGQVGRHDRGRGGDPRLGHRPHRVLARVAGERPGGAAAAAPVRGGTGPVPAAGMTRARGPRPRAARGRWAAAPGGRRRPARHWAAVRRGSTAAPRRCSGCRTAPGASRRGRARPCRPASARPTPPGPAGRPGPPPRRDRDRAATR